MERVGHLLIGTVSLFALSALPLHLDLGSLGSFDIAVAHAKGGNGGGNGNGGGSGGGNGKGSGGEHGKAGGNGKGKSASAGGALKSASGKDRSLKKADRKVQTSRTAKAEDTVRTKKRVELPEVVTVLDPAEDVTEKNLHAKLAGLNSLNRNYHAYLNSQSPRFSAVFDYVVESANGTIIDRAVLEQALLDAANQNRVAQYGDDYLDDEVMDWAEGVLDGKIDEVQDSMLIDEQ